MPLDVIRESGRTLRAEAAETGDRLLPVFFLHGTPGTSALPEPLLDVAGVRWISYARPGYPGSTPDPGRTAASAAHDIAALADALELDRFAVFGYSGGGPGALAAAVTLGDRVIAAVAVASPAPHDAAGLDFLAGMYPGGRAELAAAEQGRAALEALLAAGGDDPEMFQPIDHEVLRSPWGWLGRTAGDAFAHGQEGFLDDDLALVQPWDVDLQAITAPVLLLQGTIDRIIPPAHARWLAEHIPTAQLQLWPELGHVSVLTHAADAVQWLLDQA